MSLGDDLAAALASTEGVSVPAQRDKPSGTRFEWNGQDGWIETPALGERPTTWDAFVRDAGLDPEEVDVLEPVAVRGWDAPGPEGSVIRMHHYKLTVRRRSALLVGLPLLLSEARRIKRPARALPEGIERATIVLWADPQTGKVAKLGGTPELIARVGVYLEKLDDYLDRYPSDAAFLLDMGDAVEGFENTAGQMGTNDLSLMDQIDVASTLTFQFISLLARKRAAVGVRGIGSNHCRWRRGKDALGFPGDDWGIFMLKQLRKAIGMTDDFSHVDIAWPEKKQETDAFEVCGKIIGMAHGHQAANPDRIPDWWGRQVHGGQPIAHADILHTGHFHHLRVMPSGRNPWTNRSKWWMQACTADGGSDWYRYVKGDDADPGLVVYTLTQGVDGYPFGHLEVL